MPLRPACRTVCALFVCCLVAVADEPLCPHSVPDVKSAIDAARKNAEQISDEYIRSELLHEVAKAYARNGDFELASQVIRTDSALMWQAADELAKNMLRCDQAAEVKVLAATMDRRSKWLMLQWLAEWQAKHDDSTGSQQTLLQIEDEDIRREAKFNIITSRAIKGDAKAAEAEYRKLAAEAPNPTQGADDIAIQDLAVVYVMKGDVGAAITNLGKMKSAEKVYALYSAAQILAEKKERPGASELSAAALRIARPFLGNPDQAYPLSLLASALGKLGQFEDAIGLANSIPDQQRKNEALVMIATRLIAAGNDSRAMTLMDSLSKVPPGNAELEGEREMAWVRIAMAQANAGKGDDALKTLQKVRDPRMDSLVKWQRSYAQARAGKFAEARALAIQIHSDFPGDERGRALRLVAAVNAYDKTLSDVTDWAEHLATPADRTSAYLGVADGLLGEPNQEIPPYFQD